MNSNLYEEKKRFNAVDVLIVFTVILLILVIIFRTQILSLFTSSGTKESCHITFVCENVSKEVYENNIKDIDQANLNWINAEAKLGSMTINRESVSAARIYEKSPSGDWRYTLSDTNVRFSGSISTTLTSNNGYYVGGTDFIAPGMTITVATTNAQFDILILNITHV